MIALLLSAALIGAGAPTEAPVWPPNEVKELLMRIPQAEGAPTVEEKDAVLANIAGFAYRVQRQPAEGTELYSKRVLRKRSPDHPNVKKGQWLSALMRQFYEDLSKRCDSLSRLERDRKDRAFYESRAKEAKQIADYLAGTLEIVVEGMDGFLAPLPIAEGDPPQAYGAQATVKNGAIVIENLERVHFQNDAPPDDVIRTARGAIRELFSAQKQYNVSASTLGMYEPVWQKNKGNIRALIPAASPAIYLNELVLGALEAEMHTMHVMCMTKKGELRELAVKLKTPPAKGKKSKKPVEVGCANTLPMQKCIERIAGAKAQGTVVYVLE